MWKIASTMTATVAKLDFDFIECLVLLLLTNSPTEKLSSTFFMTTAGQNRHRFQNAKCGTIAMR
jgi:hypothetical protein